MPKVYSAGDQVTAADFNAVIKVAGLYAVDASGTDAYVFTPSPSIGSYADGDVFRGRIATANTGPATVNISGIGAKPLVKMYNIPLVTNDLRAGMAISFQYDSVNDSFQLLTPVAGPDSYAGSFNYSRTMDGTAVNDDLSVDCGFQPSVIEMVYYVQGHTSATETAAYAVEAGTGIWYGTTLVGKHMFVSTSNAGGSDATVITSTRISPSDLVDTTNPTAGTTSGSNSGAVKATLSVQSISSTGFVIRRRTESLGGGGSSIARIAVTYRAWR